MTTTAQIRWNPTKGRYQLIANGVALVSSKQHGYLTYLVAQQKHSAILKAGVKTAEVVSFEPTAPTTFTAPTQTAVADAVDVVIDKPMYTIDERFDFTRDLAKMVIQKEARALILGGKGGIGKTFTVQEALDQLGKVNVSSLMPSIEDLDPIDPDDEEPEIEDKAMAQINSFKGDYIVVKGYATPKALYRLLWENRNRTIIFDDCDPVLRDKNAVGLLKPALDSYEDRWVSWRVEGFQKDSDLPSTFKFNGSIIFITNLPLSVVDEAVLTRCYKVDLSMTFAQRLERMQAVIDRVMPDVDLDIKQSALDLIKDNVAKMKDINFRVLMNTITIANNGNSDWKRLATFTLLEH